ncbi:MAG: alanine dehydrogenase [Saprospiraceae bacterium]|jgi:alanine dehydrogenase|nr:alanine dehydrogenase [Saprospiraceae bacterium]
MVNELSKQLAREAMEQEVLSPQEKLLDVYGRDNKMFLGIPKEERMQENRVALTPNAVGMLTAQGHRVMIEKGAGKRSFYQDNEYSEAGAEVVHSKEEIFKANIILKVVPPTTEEIDLMPGDQVIISPLHMPLVSEEYLNALRNKRITAIAMEYLKDRNDSFPIVRALSEIAGLSAVLTAAELLSVTSQGRGVLLGGIAGIPPAKVMILGAGVVGEFATKAALGLGASVRVFDNNIYKLMRLQNSIGIPLHTSVLNPKYLEYQIKSADVVIGAIHSKTGRAPMVVSEDMVMKMKQGSVIIDISIDQGGCFETSEVTTHDHPTFVKHGVIHYCVPNIASKVPRTSSSAISNIIAPLLSASSEMQSIDEMLYANPGLRHGVYTYNGHLTNEYLAKRFGIKYTDINLLLTSDN